jgi:N-acetylglucosamine-6-sulfatase
MGAFLRLAFLGGVLSLPNIVYIMSDDQDIELGGLTPMPKLRKLLGEQGATGEAFYIATPICCPSRTETLSGRLYHNVLGDKLGGCMHVNHTHYIFDHPSAIFPALQAAGYATGGFGKLINGQGGVFQNNFTRGWDWLSAPLDEGDYFANEFFEKRPNGTTWVSSLGKKADVVDAWHQTPQIGNRSLEFIEYAVAAKRPFVAYLGPHAPHYSADSPPWNRDAFAGLTAPRVPAYNASGDAISSKARHIAQNPPLDAEAEAWIDIHMRNRWRAIQGMDDMIELVMDRLAALGVLDDTYVFFSSDHGYKLGAWRVGCSKQHPYESDIHIPFFARGPGIAPGTVLSSLGSNIDIGPTLLDIAGLPPNPAHDGVSLMPQLRTMQGTPERAQLETDWRTSLIIEYASVGTYYNDHANQWLSGPAATPGTPVKYGTGPYKPASSTTPEAKCAGTEVAPGGKCYFVDSEASNNWIALRVRNSTHNLVLVQSFGANAMTAPTFSGDGRGVFVCQPGDLCASELYDYGAIVPNESCKFLPHAPAARAHPDAPRDMP